MSVSATGLLQDQGQSLEQDVAAGASVAGAGDRLDDRGTDVARDTNRGDRGPNAKPGSRGKRIQPSRGSLAQDEAGDAGRVEVADGESRAALDWDHEANIHVRMIRAQAMAKPLEKEKPDESKPGKSSGGEGFFKNGYISHDAVTAEAVRILTRNGLHFQPYVKSHKQEGNKTVVEMEGVITNVDNPDEKLVFFGFGYGVDPSDKGPGKAMSYAKKMVLSQALMLNTHEDIETGNTPFQPDTKPDAVREAEATAETAIKSWADAYRAALTNCKSLPDLKRIRAENAHMMNNQNVPQVTKDFFIDMITQLEGSLQ